MMYQKFGFKRISSSEDIAETFAYMSHEGFDKSKPIFFTWHWLMMPSLVTPVQKTLSGQNLDTPDQHMAAQIVWFQLRYGGIQK